MKRFILWLALAVGVLSAGSAAQAHGWGPPCYGHHYYAPPCYGPPHGYVVQRYYYAPPPPAYHHFHYSQPGMSLFFGF